MIFFACVPGASIAGWVFSAGMAPAPVRTGVGRVFAGRHAAVPVGALPHGHDGSTRETTAPLFSRENLQSLVIGALLVAGSLWLLNSATAHLDSLARIFGPTGLLRLSGSSGPGLPFAAAAAGVGAGSLHALAGPDHLAALAPLALRSHRQTVGGTRTAFRTGVFWGSGHVLGQSMLGLALFLISRSSFIRGLTAGLNLEVIGEMAATGAVGVVLMIIGALGLWGEGAKDQESSATSAIGWQTFATGVISGLHPDALLFCLPALVLPRLPGLIFLGTFGASTLVTMGGYTAGLQAAASSMGIDTVKRVSVISSGVAFTLGVIICGSAFIGPLIARVFV